MNTLCIKNACVVTPTLCEHKDVFIADGRFTDKADPAATVLDAHGQTLIPGLMDMHTHGAFGVDANDLSADKLTRLLQFTASQGVTGQLLSVLTDSEERTLAAIHAITAAMKEHPQLLGIHLEGPFLASAYKGAMPERLLQKGDASLLHSYQTAAEGHIRYLTLAPEVEGALEVIAQAKKEGIVVAIGHSGADYDTAMNAIACGALAVTHTFNAMALLHQHRPAILGAALESEAYCEMICDGRHLHPAIVRLLIKCKGLSRVMAVTDSIMAAGLPDGEYKLGINDVTVKDGDALLTETGVRAGSTLTSIQALHNMMRFTDLPLQKALMPLTANPAALFGLPKGDIAAGLDADCVLLNAAGEVQTTISRGNIIFSKA